MYIYIYNYVGGGSEKHLQQRHKIAMTSAASFLLGYSLCIYIVWYKGIVISYYTSEYTYIYSRLSVLKCLTSLCTPLASVNMLTEICSCV